MTKNITLTLSIITVIIVGLFVYAYIASNSLISTGIVGNQTSTSTGAQVQIPVESQTIETYITTNISNLSPKSPTLGGTFYVTHIESHKGVGAVSYEDGHNAYVADFTYTIDSQGIPTILSFVVREGTTPVATSTGYVSANISLKVGAATTVENSDVRIKLNGIVSDSRCAVDVQCIQAGSVTVNVTLTDSTVTRTFDLISNQPTYSFSRYKIGISDVSPTKYSTIKLNQEDYVVTFHIDSLK